jgi:hypothetical protein
VPSLILFEDCPGDESYKNEHYDPSIRVASAGFLLKDRVSLICDENAVKRDMNFKDCMFNLFNSLCKMESKGNWRGEHW